jgi:hypothetical protein
MGDFKEIRELARKYSPEQIESCISQQLETGRNVCLQDHNSLHIINELSKASFIRERMEKGMPLPDAIRELADKMRRLHEVSKGKVNT